MKARSNELVTVFTIFLLSYILKSYKIENGNFVIWDEAHFGKFSSKTLTRSFYFDVHPPLGKMLTSLSGYIFNQPTDFKFDSSEEYPSLFDYCGMRRFHALIASVTPILAYLILKEIGYGYSRRFVLSLLFIFENGLTSIGRLILLDSHLLTFTAAVVYFMTRWYFKQSDWALLFLGVSIGCVISVKWIGLMTMMFVGLLIIYQLWCNAMSKAPLYDFGKLFCKKLICLVLIPLTMYTFLFWVHFKIINRSSPDEAYMSSFFQASLIGNQFNDTRKYIRYGTQITLKSCVSGGGNLHSHDHTYPDSDNNQTTTYHYKDVNNNFTFQKVTNETEEATFLNNEDTVVLLHLETRKYLDVPGTESLISDEMRIECKDKPLTTTNLFKVEYEKDSIMNENQIKCLTTKFRLRNIESGCYLRASPNVYPQWGFQQGEVTCSKLKDTSTLWNIEENISDKSSTTENPTYKEISSSVFLKHLIEHNEIMFATNKSFVQDEDLEPEKITSRPYEWPILRRGLRMSGWPSNKPKFYMFGNPLIWYASFISVILSPVVFFIKVVHSKRNNKPCDFAKKEAFEVFLGFVGWLCHYTPFYFVGRVLYFHHYFPALFFSIFSICYITSTLRTRTLIWFVGLCILTYSAFSPLTYGFVTQSSVKYLKLLPTWDFID